jgi:hypothetical protein
LTLKQRIADKITARRMRAAQKTGLVVLGRQSPEAALSEDRVDYDPVGPTFAVLPLSGTATVSIVGNVVDALTPRVPYRINPDGAMTLTLTIPGTERGTFSLVIRTEP